MGNFYVNYTPRGPSQDEVAKVLAERAARVTPVHKGCVVAFDEESDTQNTEVISALAATLSKTLACPCLTVLNHDDDILCYQLHEGGKLVDEYDSTPGYFDARSQPSPPAGGDAAKLCAAFGGDVEIVEKILRSSSFKGGGYVFAVNRHAELVKALGISDYSVGTAFESFDNDELPDGLSGDDITETSGGASWDPHIDDAAVQREYKKCVELFVAAAKDDADAVRRIVTQLNVNPNVTLDGGSTPLHNACRGGALAAAKALLDLGADTNLRYTDLSTSGEVEVFRTVLMYAGSAAVVELLLKYGADPNQKDAAGYTPLMQAAKRRDLEAIELLLSAGANPLARAQLHDGNSRNAREFAEAWLKLYERQPSSEEILQAVEKAKRVVERLYLAEQRAANNRL